VTLVIYNYLNDRVRQVVGMMEIAGTRIVNLRTALDEASGGTGDAHCALPA